VVSVTNTKLLGGRQAPDVVCAEQTRVCRIFFPNGVWGPFDDDEPRQFVYAAAAARLCSPRLPDVFAARSTNLIIKGGA